MANNIITNADDVELILEADGVRRGSSTDMGRIVVDDFSITKDEDITSESGVGQRLPAGLSRGDIEHGFSFTMLGEDVAVFEMIANADGESQVFSFTARKTEDDGLVRWEYSLDTCMASSEELSASSGDPMEYAVEGLAVRVDKRGTRSSGETAWD